MMTQLWEFWIVYFHILAIWQVLAAAPKIRILDENADAEHTGDTGRRILSGWEATPGQHPWQLALRLTSPEGSVLGCGGVLVHESWGLTAAHCTAGRITIVVRAGLINLTTPAYISETIEFYSHPSYDAARPADAQPNDISIVRLNPAVSESAYAMPIRIQHSKDAFNDYSGKVVYSSGFGRVTSSGGSIENLHWVFLRAVSNAQCRGHYGDVITDNTVCAGPYNVTSQSVCFGDSGGPLVHTIDGQPTLIGITSFVMGGDSGCHSGYPGAFSRPGPHHAWFTRITGIDFDLEQQTTTTEVPTEAPTSSEEKSCEEDDSQSLEEDTSQSLESLEEDSGSLSEEEESQFAYDFRKFFQIRVKVKVKINNNITIINSTANIK